MVQTRSKGKKSIGSPPPPKQQRKVRDRVSSIASPRKKRVAVGVAAAVAAESPLRAEEVSSDEFDLSEEEDEEESPASETGAARASAPTKEPADESSVGSSQASQRQRLPKNITRQLLIDIQLAGGIDKFHLESEQALCDLCAKRPELYGPRGSSVRLRIGRKVARWKKKDKTEWLEVLMKSKVDVKPTKKSQRAEEEDAKPAAAKPAAAKPADAKPADAKLASRFPASVSVPNIPNAASSIASVSVTAYRMSHAGNTRKFSWLLASLTRHNSLLLLLIICLLLLSTVNITVNPDHPESNGPFLVYDVPDLPGTSGVQYKGFYLILPIDTRFVDMDDEVAWYTGACSGSKGLLFKLPAWPFVLYPKGDSRKHYDNLLKAVPEYVQRSMNDAHSFFDPGQADEDLASNATAQAESRKWRYINLDFSSVKGSWNLSSKHIFADAGEREVLDYDYIEVPNAGGRADAFLGFRVARIPIDSGSKGAGRKVQRSDAQKSKLQQKRDAAKAKMETG